MADVAKLNENDKDVTAVSTEVAKTQDNVNTPSNETPTTEKEETETKKSTSISSVLIQIINMLICVTIGAVVGMFLATHL